jgi:hypothetical protein
MNSNQVNQNVLPFPWFPKTNPPLAGGAQSGEWIQRPQNQLEKLADTLDYSANVARVNSLPSPWSRARQLEQAITNAKYPTKAELLDELFGCLACIGLWKSYGLILQAKPVSLATLAASNSGLAAELANTLFSLRPGDENSLYKPSNGISSWEKIYVLELDGVNIGFTSPLTLVCPTAYLPGPIPGMEGWTSNGCFTSPIQHLGNSKKEQLADWLRHIGQAIAVDGRYMNSAQMVSRLGTILDQFADRLHPNSSGTVALASEAANGFPLMGPKAITALGTPIGGIAKQDDGSVPSQATILLGERLERPFSNTPQKPLILLDPTMGEKLDLPAQELILYGNATAQSTRYEKNRLASQYADVVDIIDLDDIFLPELYLLSGDTALVESSTWLSSCYQGIPSINGLSCTPLLPFQERIRDLYSSSELSRMCSMRVTDEGGAPALEVKLLVNIKGLDVPYPITKTFAIKKENVIDDPKPVITVWPYVSDEIWKKYYIFTQMTSTRLSLDGFADYRDHDLNKDTDEHVRYYESDRFPDILKLIENGKARGIIPLKTPPRFNFSSKRWRVGFDFGTSFTNFAIDDGSSGPQRRPLKTNLMPVTLAEKYTQDELLYDYFIPQILFPEDSNPPTATALNTIQTTSIPSLFHQARVQWPSAESQAFRKDGIKTGFKWDEEQYQYPFILQLAMLISANAVAEKASSIDWYVSYPSAFSPGKTIAYRRLWERLCQDLVPLTGLTHDLVRSEDSRALQTEAVAFAKYFGNYLQSVNLAHTACMDVGGGTTDISIWQKNQCIHQVSVKFAGRNICTNLLASKMSITRLLFEDEIRSRGSVGEDDASLRNNPNFNSWVDNILRNSTAVLYENIRLRRRQADEGGRILSKLTSLIAIAFGGLYYYVGIVLRSLSQEGILADESAMPVLIGGNGAHFLYWIEGEEKFDRYSEIQTLFEQLQVMGSGFTRSPKGTALTTISKDLKDESALGLISLGRSIEHEPNIEDSFIAGEAVTIGDKVYTPSERITLNNLKANIGSSYQVDKGLGNLRAFVHDFNTIVSEMESLLPINELEPNDTLLWTEVRRNIEDECAEFKKLTDARNIDPEPPFIIGLKALLKALAKLSLVS